MFTVVITPTEDTVADLVQLVKLRFSEGKDVTIRCDSVRASQVLSGLPLILSRKGIICGHDRNLEACIAFASLNFF